MIEVENLTVEAGRFRLDQISFSVPEGGYAVLMGKTGCGKTTLLEAICGLRPISSGTVRLQGVDVTRLRSGERGIGFVPQESALFSHLTVRRHLSFGPELAGWEKAEIESQIEELAKRLEIEALLNRKPEGLSGGEKQRVSLGRAVAARPSILCLDEPLGALDEDTHESVMAFLGEIAEKERMTVLHITHNRGEAEVMADLVLQLEGGRVATR